MNTPPNPNSNLFGDTAAYLHVTANEQHIQQPRATLETPSQGFVGNSQGLKVHSSGSIPYQVLFGQLPDFLSLKAFGCSCFPCLRPYNTHKLDFRSHECVFLGYSSSHKGYKCLSPNGCIYVSEDVVFNEHKFPYKDLFETGPKPSSFPTSSTDLPSSTIFTVSPSQSSLSPNQSLNQFPSSPSPQTSVVQPTNLSPLSTGSYPFIAQAASPTIDPNSPSPTLSPPATRPANTHPMQTRAKVCTTLLLTHVEPKSVKSALQQPAWQVP